MNSMEKIRLIMEQTDFKIKDIIRDDNGNISHIYAEKGLLYYCVVAPHSGNDFSYMLRRNAICTFDRWSMADLEDFYDSAEDLLSELSYIKDLEATIVMWGTDNNG